jgi:tetraacyldisaccharide 4'-kinase
MRRRLHGAGILRSERARIPVISVGNISLGGSEKTPLAMELLRYLLDRGRRPALISRGYRGRWEKKGGVVSDGSRIMGTWQDSGDEPYLVARTLPRAGVFVGKRRLTSCRKAAAAGFDLAVLDDGFQHLKLYRDLDIVLFSPGEKPALREPPSALRRADILLLKANEPLNGDVTKVMHSFCGEIFTYAVSGRGFRRLWDGEDFPSEALNGRKVLPFCGIARPKRFLDDLRRQGLDLAPPVLLRDHYTYPPSSLEMIMRLFAQSGAEALVTTEKDALKIEGERQVFGTAPVYVSRIGLDLEPGFFARLDRFLSQAEKS